MSLQCLVQAKSTVETETGLWVLPPSEVFTLMTWSISGDSFPFFFIFQLGFWKTGCLGLRETHCSSLGENVYDWFNLFYFSRGLSKLYASKKYTENSVKLQREWRLEGRNTVYCMEPPFFFNLPWWKLTVQPVFQLCPWAVKCVRNQYSENSHMHMKNHGMKRGQGIRTR